MTVLAVDLAAKFSAACLMDDAYQVITQFDSWGMTESQFVYQLYETFQYEKPYAEIMILEDLPHGLRYSTLIKTVCRLQGRIFHHFEREANSGDDILFLSPAEWRRTFDGMKRGTGPDVVVPVAAGLGYTPPDLSERAKVKGGKAIARKVATDYCSAYLIARWAVNTKAQYGTYDITGTSRYDTRAILKKDFDAKNR